MQDVKINTSKTVSITLPADPDSNAVSVSVYHESNDIVYGPVSATRIDTGKYSVVLGQQPSGDYILSSAGRYRIDFSYDVSTTPYTKGEYINVYTPYVDETQFFELYPELEIRNLEKFDYLESRARNIVNTYCGQSFEPYKNKTVILQGNGHTRLNLPLPIYNLYTVTKNPGRSTEELIHDFSNQGLNNLRKTRQPFNFESSYYIEWINSSIDETLGIEEGVRFSQKADYKIVGDYGWAFVPNNVEQATSLILADIMNDDSEYRRHGIYAVSMDAVNYTMKSEFYESTGNIEADVLLMDYMIFVMDYVV
jgi:hypothetical protein